MRELLSLLFCFFKASLSSQCNLVLENLARQVIEAFPEETAPRFLLRDRDQIYGEEFRRRVAGMRIEEVMTAQYSPWQSPYVERLIGSVLRERLNHLIVLNETHLRGILKS